MSETVVAMGKPGSQTERLADAAARQLADFVREHAGLQVLSGAGCSTGAGIPAYRDQHGRWANPAPIQFADFRHSSTARQRYWARSFTGWPRFAAATPARAHRALATLERAGLVGGVVTQNVDGLHSAAGSRDVIDLHGRLDRVACLDCRRSLHRSDLQRELESLNGWWHAEVSSSAVRPDGDTDVPAAHVARFRFPECPACGGTLKPDVVFFGENVPKARVDEVRSRLAGAPALLVVGSSLMVLSGYRFVREAVAAGKPVMVLNQGATRADADPIVKLDEECGACLALVAAALGADCQGAVPG